MKNNSIDFNFFSLFPETIEDLKTGRDKFSGRIEESSFRRIPSIVKFDVKSGVMFVEDKCKLVNERSKLTSASRVEEVES